MTFAEWNSQGMRVVGKTSGRELWVDELHQLRKNRKLCGHDRLKRKTRCPVQLLGGHKRKCMFQWGTSRLAVLTGCFSALLDNLDPYEMPWQHVKVFIDHKEQGGYNKDVRMTVDNTTYVGMYIGHENFDQSPRDAFDKIVSLAKKM